MNIKGALALARMGRPDLLACNAASLLQDGLSHNGVLRLIAVLVARYPHASGERLSPRQQVTLARWTLRTSKP